MGWAHSSLVAPSLLLLAASGLIRSFAEKQPKSHTPGSLGAMTMLPCIILYLSTHFTRRSTSCASRVCEWWQHRQRSV
ncbi:hypothetical protein V8C43DRAFT_293768 [Trichoderma afarasin]